MPITGWLQRLEYDLGRCWCRGSFALIAVRYLVLVALLGACTSLPPANGGDSENARANKEPVKSVSRADTGARHCVALAMYWEARGEGQRGMVAVGSVVLNRVEDNRFPDSVCGVVHQGGETPPCQFSWWCDGKSDRPTHEDMWATSLSLADQLLVARPHDPTHGALFFHNTSIKRPWRRERTARIGNHVFYR